MQFWNVPKFDNLCNLKKIVCTWCTCGKMDESAGVLGMEKHLYSKEQIIYGNWVDYTFGKYPLLSFFSGGWYSFHSFPDITIE